MGVNGTAGPGASGRDALNFVCGSMHLGGGASIGEGYLGIDDGIRRANGFGCWAGCPYLDGGLLNSGYGCGMPHESHSVAWAEYGSGTAYGFGYMDRSGYGTGI